MRGRFSFLGVLATVIAASALSAPAAMAVPASCPVATSTDLTTALGNVNCDPIVLAAGTYSTATSPAFNIARGVTLTGAGVGQTIITRTGTGNVLNVAGNSGDQINLSGMTIGGAPSGTGVNVSAGPAITLNLTNVVVSNNTDGGSGGGIYFASPAPGALNVTDSVISGNTDSGFQGGGVDDAGTGVASFNRVLFSGNSSTGTGGGGGFSQDLSGATSNFTNVTFTGNQAKNNGGALRNGSNGIMNLVAVTVAGNTADSDNTGGGNGGGVFTNSGTVSVRDSIIANNADLSGGALDCSGTIKRLGYELVRDPTGCTFGGAGDVATGYQTGVDPLLGPLAANGGATQTMALMSGSPALDAIPAGSCATVEDQRTVARPQGSGCDLGAFELQVTTTTPPTPPPPVNPPPPDTTAPNTLLGKSKIKKSKRSAKFSFSSSETGSTFQCSLDKKPFLDCSSPTHYKHIKRGKHTFAVAAVDNAGNMDATPATKKFKIKG